MSGRIAALSLALCCVASVAWSATAGDIAALLGNAPIKGVEGETLRARASVERFYAGRGDKPAWSNQGRPTAALDKLFYSLGHADRHGLRPADYHLAALNTATLREDWAAVDLLATDAYLTLGAHLLDGRVDRLTLAPVWTAAGRSRDLVAHLNRALDIGNIHASLEALAPPAPAYRTLRRALAIYRAAAEAGDPPPVPDGPALKLGSSGERVRLLRDRLSRMGLKSAAAGPADLFDPALETAVAAFQRRIGIEADGIAGPVTLGAVNKTAAQRVQQIRANLERWRWLPDSLGDRHIRVHIADFELEAWEHGKVVQRHDVIIGRTYRRTPMFSDLISYVIFNPWWETPPSIARQDKLPAFQRDPGQVERLGFQVLDRAGKPVPPATIDWRAIDARDFPYRLRQKPGPLNALGRVKIMFPNPYNVYLHDTPSQELFNRSRRDFSSGCVRVSGVMDLVEWLLADTPGWDRARMRKAVESGRETRVNLATKVPVHILYLTVMTSPDGTFRFVNDVYDQDPPLIAALDRPPPPLAGR